MLQKMSEGIIRMCFCTQTEKCGRKLRVFFKTYHDKRDLYTLAATGNKQGIVVMLHQTSVRD